MYLVLGPESPPEHRYYKEEDGSGAVAKMRLFKINIIRRPINSPDASRKRTENVENEPVTEQTRTAETSDAEHDASIA